MKNETVCENFYYQSACEIPKLEKRKHKVKFTFIPLPFLFFKILV